MYWILFAALVKFSIKLLTIFSEGYEKDTDDVNEEENPEDAGNNPGLVEEEAKDVGVVKYDVYRSYWRAAGVCLTFSIFLSLFFMQGKVKILLPVSEDYFAMKPQLQIKHYHLSSPILFPSRDRITL